MRLKISVLEARYFRHCYGMSTLQPAAQGVTRHVVDAKPAFPDRIEMRDCEPGEPVLLPNHAYQPAANALQAISAIGGSLERGSTAPRMAAMASRI